MLISSLRIAVVFAAAVALGVASVPSDAAAQWWPSPYPFPVPVPVPVPVPFPVPFPVPVGSPCCGSVPPCCAPVPPCCGPVPFGGPFGRNVGYGGWR
jgi:hypothetical protein